LEGGIKCPTGVKNRVDICGKPEDIKKFMDLAGRKFNFLVV